MASLARCLQGLKMLRLNKIGKRFENGTTALSEVNLEIAPRTIVSVVGASGSGKSTLLRIISGLEAPTTGELFWCGEPIEGPRRDIGFIFQEPRLMPWLTVTANVRLGLGPIRESKGRVPASLFRRTPRAKSESLADDLVSEAIRKVGLERFARVFPRELSGGMAQRVAIARALVRRPSLILLDEPFSALDAINRHKLQNHLLKIWEKDRPTLLVVTHDVEEALLFGDRVLVLSGDPGRITDDYLIELPRPRDRIGPGLQRWKETIVQSLDLSLIEPAKTLEQEQHA
jgi:sulfonate transport system ATP-binding protein